jgi:hypothetical protein
MVGRGLVGVGGRNEVVNNMLNPLVCDGHLLSRGSLPRGTSVVKCRYSYRFVSNLGRNRTGTLWGTVVARVCTKLYSDFFVDCRPKSDRGPMLGAQLDSVDIVCHHLHRSSRTQTAAVIQSGSFSEDSEPIFFCIIISMGVFSD